MGGLEFYSTNDFSVWKKKNDMQIQFFKTFAWTHWNVEFMKNLLCVTGW